MIRSFITLIIFISVFVLYCGCEGNDQTQHPNCEGENHPPGGHPSGNPPGGHPPNSHPPDNPPGGHPPNSHPPDNPNGHPPCNHPGENPNHPGGNPGNNPNHPGGNPGGHSGSSPSNNPTGHFGGNINGKFTVVISFDSLEPCSKKFFINQLKPIYKEFSECCYWQFIPCSTLHIVDDVLHCQGGVAECQIDVLHACAAHFYENDQHKLGEFFICMMTTGCEYTNGEKCAKQVGMDWATLNNCQPSKDAGTFCDNRYKQLNALHEPSVPGVMYNYKYDTQAENESLNNLKTGICNQIKKNNMKCAACGNTGGGNCPGGNGPGGSGHGGNGPGSNGPGGSGHGGSGPGGSGHGGNGPAGNGPGGSGPGGSGHGGNGPGSNGPGGSGHGGSGPGGSGHGGNGPGSNGPGGSGHPPGVDC